MLKPNSMKRSSSEGEKRIRSGAGGRSGYADYARSG